VAIAARRAQNPGMSEEVIERLEAKIAYLEAANSELSDVVYRQQQEIEALRTQILAVLARLDNTAAAGVNYTLEQEKPPHY
jgi:uncharacterized coiled-coil protein SlyX